jgi:hypothetical protein
MAMTDIGRLGSGAPMGKIELTELAWKLTFENVSLRGDLKDARAKIEQLRAALQDIADLRYDNTSAATIAQGALNDRHR